MRINDLGTMRADFVRKANGLVLPNRVYLNPADYHTIRLDAQSASAFHQDSSGRDQYVFGMKITVISSAEKTYLAYDPFLEN